MYERYPDGSAYDYQIFLNDPNIWDKCSFDPEKPTRILIHGWTHGKDVPWLIEMRQS